MELRFKADTKDYFAAQQHICRAVARHSFWRFVPPVVGGIFGFSTILGVVSIAKFYERYRFIDFYELNWGLGAIAVGCLAWIFGLRAYARALRSRMFRPDGIFRSPHIITLAESQLQLEVKGSKYAYAYADLLKIEDTPHYLYVFIDDGAALYVPARCFQSPEAKQAFIGELTARMDRAPSPSS